MNQKKKRPTLQDVANVVGVTKMTVSRYLRDPSQVSEAIGEKIASAVEELGYVANRAPDLLSRAKSNAIGVLVPSITNQVFDEMIRGIEQVTEAAGYQTMLAHYGYSKATEEARIETLLSYNVDGIILSESFHTERVKKMLHATGIPVVEVMDSVSPFLQQAVGFDNMKACQLMTEALIDKGRKHIVYFGAGMDIRTQQRIEGYLRALENAGLTPNLIRDESPSSFTLGCEFLNRAREEFPDMDGIICTNDDLAVGALFECQRLGINIPQEISIAGFHGLNISQVVSPRLSTVITPREEMGKIAAESLLERINAPNKAFERVIDLPVTVYAGESI